MERTRKKVAQEVICGMARTSCIAILKAGVILDTDTIVNTCQYISSLCKKFEDPACQVQSETCYQAANFLREGNEDKYVELCEKAAKSCPYAERFEKEQAKLKKKQKKTVKNSNKKRIYI